MLKSLQEKGIEVITFFGVKSNPTVEHAREGITITKAEKPDVFIALGGGAVSTNRAVRRYSSTHQMDFTKTPSDKQHEIVRTRTDIVPVA